MTTLRTAAALGGLLCALGAAAAGAARADLKVVQETSITGLPASFRQQVAASGAGGAASSPGLDGKPITSTVFYKGDRMRDEEPGQIILTSGAAEGGAKTFVLDPSAHTYYIRPAAAAAAAAGPFGSMLANMSLTGDVTVDPRTGDTRTLAGKTATQHKYAGTFHLSLGGSDAGDAGAAAGGLALLNIAIAGEQWTSDSVAAPTALSSASGPSGMMSRLPLMNASGGKKLAAGLSSIKGFPLLSTMTFAISIPADSPLASAPSGMLPTTDHPIVARTEVKSLSEDPLPDDLFVVPSDYKLVDPPSPAGGGAGAAAPGT